MYGGHDYLVSVGRHSRMTRVRDNSVMCSSEAMEQ